MTTERPESAREPWQWPEAHWRKLVDRVRAGKTLAAGGMAGRARAARSRCRSTATTRPAICAKAASRSAGSPGGRYGARVGVPRILKLLDKYQVKASFYVPGGDRAAAPRRAAPRRRRGPRDRHPRLDPRAEFGAALRGRARFDAALRRGAGKDAAACGRSACARRPGISAGTRWRSSRRWACSTIRR